jgi:hypothetical protein
MSEPTFHPSSQSETPPYRAPGTNSTGSKLEIRVSTVLVAIAALSMALAAVLSWLESRLSHLPLDLPVLFLAWGVFPVCSLAGAVSALVFALWRRRWQFLIEFILAAAFLAYISTWEFL